MCIFFTKAKQQNRISWLQKQKPLENRLLAQRHVLPGVKTKTPMPIHADQNVQILALHCFHGYYSNATYRAGAED